MIWMHGSVLVWLLLTELSAKSKYPLAESSLSNLSLVSDLKKRMEEADRVSTSEDNNSNFSTQLASIDDLENCCCGKNLKIVISQRRRRLRVTSVFSGQRCQSWLACTLTLASWRSSTPTVHWLPLWRGGVVWLLHYSQRETILRAALKKRWYILWRLSAAVLPWPLCGGFATGRWWTCRNMHSGFACPASQPLVATWRLDSLLWACSCFSAHS